MGDVIRRGKTVPVQARRANAGGGTPPPFTPTVIDVPGMATAPTAPPATAPTAAGGGVQNVIYVVAPAAAPVPPPVEVHHHHHTTEVIAPVRRRRPSKGTSFLGTLGMVVGGVGCLAAYLPQVVAFARPIAVAGFGMAALAWVGAILFRRVGAGLPFVGMLVSAAAYGLWLNNTGQAQGAYDRLRQASPVPLPAMRLNTTPTVAPAPPPTGPASSSPHAPASPAVTPAPVLPPTTPQPPRKPTIFDTDSPGWTHPSGSR